MSNTSCDNLDETQVPAKKLKQARLVFKPLASPTVKKENAKNTPKRKFKEVDDDDVVIIDEDDSNKDDSKENKNTTVCQENGTAELKETVLKKKKLSVSDDEISIIKEVPLEPERCSVIKTPSKDVKETRSQDEQISVKETPSEEVKEHVISKDTKNESGETDFDKFQENLLKEDESSGEKPSDDAPKEAVSGTPIIGDDVLMEEDSSESAKETVSEKSKDEINEDDKSKESLASSGISEELLNVSSSSIKDPVTPIAVKTPTSEIKTPKPRKLTPKQIEKQQEKEKLRLEKERKRTEELEMKLKIKREKEEAKRKEQEEKEKVKREKEDAKKKELEEKKKMEELKKKEKEEKEKRRLAEIEQRNEEKLRREEEKRKAEEEKKKQEELKQQGENKVKAAFASFFVKKQKTEQVIKTEKSETVTAPASTAFMPFQEKPCMKLAPVNRVTLAPEQITAFDNVVLSAKNSEAKKLYLDQLKSANYQKKTSGKTWPFNVEGDDDVDIIESDTEMEADTNIERSVRTMRAKLLQFHENQRPPYYGTWRKKSKVIKPHNPFQKDTVYFDYEVDSDDEWEEGEGESLRGSDDEKESEDDYEVDNETFVPHGYLSDEEVQEEEDAEDMNPEDQKLKLKLLGEEFEADMNTKTERLKPVLVGPMWINNNVEETTCVDSRIVKYLIPRRAVWKDPNSSISTSGPPIADEGSPDASAPASASKSRQFTDDEIKSLIHLIHGSIRNRVFLSREFCRYLESQSSPASIRSVNVKIKEIASYVVCPINEGPKLTGRKCWFVSPEIRTQYGLSDLKASDNPHVASMPDVLPSPTASPAAVPCITKFTKVLSEEDRLKQLAEPVVDHSKLQANCHTTASASHGNTSLITKFTKVLTEEECLKQLASPLSDKSAKPCDKVSKSPSIVNFLNTQKSDTSSASSPASSSSNPLSAPKEKKRLPLLASVKVGEEIPKAVRPSCALNTANSADKDCKPNNSEPQPMETDIPSVKCVSPLTQAKEKKRLPLLASVKVGEEIPAAVRPSCALNAAKSADKECQPNNSEPQPMETDIPSIKCASPITQAKEKKRLPLLASVKVGEEIPAAVRPSCALNAAKPANTENKVNQSEIKLTAANSSSVKSDLPVTLATVSSSETAAVASPKTKKRVPLLVSVKRGEKIPLSVRPSAALNPLPKDDKAATSSSEEIGVVVSKPKSHGEVELVDLDEK